MADGRDVGVWDNHAQECREANRVPFEFNLDDSKGGWLRKKVMSVLKPAESKVLDLGCGPGYWRNLFSGYLYTGMDQSEEMLKLASEIPPKLVWVRGQAREASEEFGAECFDMVFTASVLQHNRHSPDKEEIVREIHKLLKPRGYFLCTENTYRADNCPESVGNPEHTDGYSFTPQGWQKFFEDRGFEFLDFSGHGEYFFRKI